MKVANEWADGEDSVRDKDRESPHRDNNSWSRRDSRGSDRRRKRKSHHYDDADGAELVAAGYVDTRDERDRNGGRQDDRSGSRQDNRRDSRDYGQRSDGYRKREWQKTRDDSKISAHPQRK